MTGIPHIALISLSPLRVGGIETHLLQIMTGMRGEFDFTVIGDLGEPFSSRAESLGAQCVFLRSGAKLDLPALIRLRREILERGIDIVHTHDTRGGLLGRIAGKWAGRRTIHTVHTPSFFLPRNRTGISVYQLAERILNKRFSDRVIFVSKSIRSQYLEKKLVTPDCGIWIPNGLNPEWFYGESHRQSKRAVVEILFIGRLAVEKGIGNLAAAFALLTRRLGNVRLVVVGAGSEGKFLKMAAESEGWSSCLDYRGSLPPEDLKNVYHQADVYVLPSRFESMSYTLMEAMASGLPCVATNVGGNPDLIEQDRTGLLVPPEQPEALARALLRLAEDQDLRRRLGAAGRRKVLGYTRDEMVDRLRFIYTRIV